MKRTMALVLALSLLCSTVLVACSGGHTDNPDVKDSDKPLNDKTLSDESFAERLEDTESSTNALSEYDYINRRLSNNRLNALLDADLETLQAEISTIGDATSFLDRFEPNGYGEFDKEIRLDIDFLFDLHTKPEMTTPQTYAAFAAWCLADDYDGIQYIISTGTVGDDNILRVLPALALPLEDGYYIYDPSQSSFLVGFDRTRYILSEEVSDLKDLKNTPRTSLVDYRCIQVFVADAEQRTLTFSLDETTMLASLSSGSAEMVFPVEHEEDPPYMVFPVEHEEDPPYNVYAWDRLHENWASYELSASMEPTLSKEQVEGLVGKDLNTVADACKTLGDCLYYYALSGFTGSSGDLRTADQNIGDGNLEWHYNYAPEAVFAQNTGNCGGSSGLTAYLLQGDYDTVGMLGMTFAEGEGGHFINYVWDGKAYYVFDIVNLLSSFQQNGFCFSRGDTLQAAADQWMERSQLPVVRLMWAYQSFDGDVPVGWDFGNSRISYLPIRYKDGAQILKESPEEGYVYKWVSISDEVWSAIKNTRRPVTDRPGVDVVIDTSGNYSTRVLTDDQLLMLMGADKKVLQQWISTVADAVAYLDLFRPISYDFMGNWIYLDIDDLLSLHTRNEATISHTYAAFAAWCLADDYDGIQYIVSIGRTNQMVRAISALALPTADGYYIYTPAKNSTVMDNSGTGFIHAAEVDTLDHLEKTLRNSKSDYTHLQIFVADAEQRGLTLYLDRENGRAKIDSGNAELIYNMSEEKRAELIEKERATRAAFAWSQLEANWKNYGLPACFKPTLTKTQVEALIGKDLDTVAASLKTMGDVMYYFALSGYKTIDGDLDVPDGDYAWSFNHSPQKVFAENEGNCGGTAGIVAYFLQGDYDETGILTMTCSVELGGGHVINYIEDNGTCYVFDARSMCDSSFQTIGAPICIGEDIVEAGRVWQAQTNNEYRLICAYSSTEGDMPGMGTGKVGYLPNNYRDRITIVYEDTANGYKYEWRTISDDILKKIDETRNS